MKHSHLAALGLGALLAGQLALADDPAPEALVAARHVAVTICANCHGQQGRSENPKFPRLAAQHPSYLAAQLRIFKTQGRGDPDAIAYMWGMAAPLSDELIDALAVYYGAQKPVRGTPSAALLLASGKSIYEEGVAGEGIPACASCHGPDASGTDDFPRLAGQSAQYLLKQLSSFQSNMRNVAVMHGVASGLKAQEMNAVAAYLQSIGS
jgi:cytochrome c553